MPNIKQRLLASSILVAGLGLYSPIYKQIYMRSVRSFSKHLGQKRATPSKPCWKKYNRHTSSQGSSQIGTAISADGTKIYRLADNGIKLTDRQTGREKYFSLPRQFPRLSWGMDIAYDSKRDIVSIVSLGGEGYFYRFDARKGRWQDVRSLNNVDIKSLAYDPTYDRYVAWAEDFGQNKGKLLFLSDRGKLLYQENISDRMMGFDRLYDRHNEELPPVEIFARGNKLALIAHSGHSIQSIWHYDMDANTTKLTYRSPNLARMYRYSD